MPSKSRKAADNITTKTNKEFKTWFISELNSLVEAYKDLTTKSNKVYQYTIQEAVEVWKGLSDDCKQVLTDLCYNNHQYNYLSDREIQEVLNYISKTCNHHYTG